MMNNIFNEAIDIHTQWKLKLKKHIEEGIFDDLEKIGNCHVCNLGQWIYGDGAQYNRLPSFESLCTEHEQFHRVAAEVVFYTNKRDIEKAKSLMTMNGEFSQASVKLIKALMDCSKDLSDSLVKGIRNVRKVKSILQSKELKNIYMIDCNAPVMDAIKMMVDHNIGSVAIYEDTNFIGIITERSYLKKLLQQGLPTLDMPVSKMMDGDVTTIDPDHSVEQCMTLMTSTHTRHLPVLDNGKLIGILSIGDLIKEVIDDDNDTLTQLDAYVHNRYGTQA